MILFLTLLLSQLFSVAQVIPGNTGYAVPAEKNEDEMFTVNGLEHWSNKQQTIHYYCKIRSTGALGISIKIKNSQARTILMASIAGKNFVFTVPKNTHFQVMKIGTVIISTPAFYTLRLQALQATGKSIADVESISLSGPATRNIHFNSKPRRNAASVHLRYPIPDSIKAVQFYNEITVPVEADPLYTYYMACGFQRGYFGMQVNNEHERRIIFSVWDAGNEAADRNKVPDENKVQLFARGDGVIAEGFGNEGTGGHSHWLYDWKPGITYHFLVTALPDSATQTTIYTGYFFIPESQQWKLIASFKAPKDGKYLNQLYSFSEDFGGQTGQLYRAALFSNQWVLNNNGKWIELTNASFSYDATGKAGDRIDFGAGVDSGRFYLWNGGFREAHVKYGDEFNRPPLNKNPLIDLYKNADSLVQSQLESKMIFDAIAKKKFDTTGSINNLYYSILKEGKGAVVKIKDTVVANYKGYLLNGEVFDQSKSPATFPLNRLIKGWQIGLPLCRVGGSIRLIIPSALAYSIRARSPKIPPNSVLIFDIEVISVKNNSL